MNTLFSANIQVLCIFYNFYWTKCELFDEFPVAPTLQKIVWEKLQFLQLCFTVKQTSKKNYFFARDSWQCYLTCTQIEKIGNNFQFRRIFFDGVERNSYSIQHQGQPMSNHSSSQWVTTTPSNKPSQLHQLVISTPANEPPQHQQMSHHNSSQWPLSNYNSSQLATTTPANEQPCITPANEQP